MRRKCESCEVADINGLRCHETGCPEAWKDEVRECLDCDRTFEPENKTQRFCDDICQADYYGFDPSPLDYDHDDRGEEIRDATDDIRDRGW